ncbi:MAG: ABC transporter permease [Planctomycetota bacterium]
MRETGVYLRLISASLRSQLQYRASLVMLTLGHLVITASEMVAIWALFARFGSLRGWRLEEVALCYGLVNVAFAAGEMFGRGFDVFDRLIRSGQFDRYLLRPRSLAVQVLGLEMRLSRIGRMAQGLAVLAWAMASLPDGPNFWQVLLAGWAIAGGLALFVGLFAAQATVAFFSPQSLEVANAFTYGGNEAAQYPMSIYADWFGKFFTFVIPLACVTYYPALTILGRTDAIWPWFAPLAGVVFLIGGLAAWQWGVRRYR